jgi:uncharacterized membrane protein YadS
MKSSRQKRKSLNDYARYSSIGLQMGVIILLGVLGGVKLDQITRLGFPLFTILLSIISVAFAIYYVIKDLIKK